MRKLFALILAITVMATLSVTAFAADYDTTGDKGMTVTYSVAPTYTVTIPETVTIGASGTSATVSAEDVVVEKGQYVSVALAENNNFTVKTTEGAELTYTVTKDGQPVAAGGEILAVNPADGKTGSASVTFDIDEAAIQYAGTYTGSATFTIAVKDVPKTIINFTIDGETYQAEEGMTWKTWLESGYCADEIVDLGEGFVGVVGTTKPYMVCMPGAGDWWYDSVRIEDTIQDGLAYELLLCTGA